LDYAKNYERCCLERQTAFQRVFIDVMTRKAQAMGQKDHKVFSLKYVVDRYFSEGEGLRVLDCGAWNGWFLSYESPRIAQRIALDFDSHFAEELGTKGIDFALANMEKGYFPFGGSTMDIVAMTSTLEHLDCPEHIAGEIYRVLKPGGVVFITVPDIRKYKWNFWNDVTHKRPFTDKSLRFLFETHGFVTQELSPYNHNLFIAGHLFPSAIHRRLTRFRADALMYVGRKEAA
jgi:SAM-dependent methyltransferase